MRTEYNEDNYNINQLILFCINHIDINPNITNLINQLKKVRYQKNQHPTAVYESFQRCINHIKVITRILNPHLDENNTIRTITPVEIAEIFKTIIIDNNDNPKYNNNAKLNGKIKNKMAKRYAQNQNLRIEDIPEILIQIADDILPKGSYDYTDPNKHWKRYQPIQNLFNLSNTYNNKNKAVSSSSTVKYNKKCPYGNKCFSFINKKKCPNFLTKSDIAFMNSKFTRDIQIPKFKHTYQNRQKYYTNKKRRFRGNKFNKFNKRGGKFNKFKRFKKFTPFNKYKPDQSKSNNYNINLNKCPNGTSCTAWQLGKCDNHNKFHMQCSNCKIKGHPRSKCYKLLNKKDNMNKSNTNNTNNIPRYNPYKQQNTDTQNINTFQLPAALQQEANINQVNHCDNTINTLKQEIRKVKRFKKSLALCP